QPAIVVFIAVEPGAVRAGNFRALRVRNRITDIVGGRVLRAQGLDRAVQLGLHRRQQWRALGLDVRRGSVTFRRSDGSQKRQGTERQAKKSSTVDRSTQGKP